MTRKYVCRDCGWMGTPAKVNPAGNLLTLLLLTLLFVLPGILYLLWWKYDGVYVCRQCGSLKLGLLVEESVKKRGTIR